MTLENPLSKRYLERISGVKELDRIYNITLFNIPNVYNKYIANC